MALLAPRELLGLTVLQEQQEWLALLELPAQPELLG
jgi:hypothetical protein